MKSKVEARNKPRRIVPAFFKEDFIFINKLRDLHLFSQT